MWTRAAAVLLAILFQVSFPAKTPEALRRRYGKPISEAFLVRAGVAVTATYGASGETCSLMIEPRETLGRSVKPESPIIEEKLLEEISKELVPEEDRGKYKMGTFLDITCLPDNDCAGVQEDWTKLVIYRNSGEKGTRYETIKWKRAECRPAPGVHIP
ncbi:MAG: hypothetical protein WA192_03315 [Candidatus Acidiferrales bacterium]